MSSPNDNSRQMYTWLKEANVNQFVRSNEFGSPSTETGLSADMGTDTTDPANEAPDSD